ncbi:Fur family transcriptional regulator [Pediococcus pentosaceus]|uniref:Fur family transcriptional regulator n=1 Tax=Pediococcus pentosaceus TaxID=1255 RepID=UPI0020739BA2|nr:transcriptional repressor [Pediococcus pentosaceus]MCM6793522.1 transcriptional repressor [Pediococcus pentosaceus]
MNKTSKEIAVKILKANNYKLTKQRQSLLNILANHEDRYMELTELDQLMRQEYPKMSYNTIYRNIKEFSEIGIVEENQNENDGKTEVKLDCNERHTHHHHFICNNCGKVWELQMCPLSFFSEQLPGAEITGHHFELYGLCADCKQLMGEK